MILNVTGTIQSVSKNDIIDFLRLPRPYGERRKSIFSPWGWGKKIDFRAFNYLERNEYMGKVLVIGAGGVGAAEK